MSKPNNDKSSKQQVFWSTNIAIIQSKKKAIILRWVILVQIQKMKLKSLVQKWEERVLEK